MPLNPITLPTELWRRILQEATTPPGGLVTSWTHAPSERLFRGWETVEHNDPAIGTKLAIVRVCREWRDMGVELLYQWVRLMSVERTRELVNLFRASASRTSKLEETSSYGKRQPAYGWWVRRIDMAGMMCEKENLDGVFSFLQQCSRVEAMFNIPPFRPVTDERIRDQASLQVERFSNTLRHLAVRASSVSMTPGIVLNPGPVTLTALTSLTVSISRSGDQALPDWHFPSLRFLKLFEISEHILSRVLPFFDLYGPQLIGLIIRTEEYVYSLPSILSRMPNLRSLVMDGGDLDILASATGSSFPSISYIGLQPMKAGGISYDTGAITNDFSLLFSKRILPGLVSVHLLAVEDLTSLEIRWPELSDLCRSYNILLGGKEEL